MTDEAAKPVRRRTRIWERLAIMLLLVLSILALAIAFLPGRTVALPDWVTDRIETRLNENMLGGGVRLGSAAFEVQPNGTPGVVLRNVALRDATGAQIAQLNEVGARFALAEILRARVVPEVLRVSGAQITVRRSVDGAFSLGFGGMNTPAMGDLAGILDLIDASFSQAPLSDVARVEADDLTITLEDARSGRLWQATRGALRLNNDADGIGITVVSEVFNGTENLALVQLSFLSTKGSAAASLGIQIENAAATDIAAQAPALSYLEVLDAQVSGALRTVIDASGSVESFAATLEIGEGALQPTPEARPIPFNRGRAYLTYDPATRKIDFSELSVESDALRVVTDGHAYLSEFDGVWPRALVGQVQLSAFSLSPEGMFVAPANFDAGAADFRLRLDPFTIEFGQIFLNDTEASVHARGEIGADSEGWRMALDASAERLTPARLMRYWPLTYEPRTRDWLTRNVLGGELQDVNASVRFAPGGPPRFGVTYDFADARVRFLRHMPVISGGAGHAALVDGRYAMRLDAGQIWARRGGPVDLTGSTMAILDVDAKPGRMELALVGRGALEAVLDVLDNKPFEVLRKSGRSAAIAEARASFTADVALDLVKDLPVEEVAFDVSAKLRNVSSDQIVPGRLLEADTLDVIVTPTLLQVSGDATLDGLPLNAAWRQALGPGTGRESRVDGWVELSQRFLDTFGINLPPGSVSGQGRGLIALDVVPDAPVAFQLQSDLAGVALDLGALGWSKPASTPGGLTIEGALGPVPVIDALRLTGNGFLAEGDVTLAEGGRLVSADFDTVRLGNWLDVAATLTGRGPGQPVGVALTGGTIDLRNLPEARSPGAGGERVPLSIALDRMIVSEGIALAPFRGEIVTGSGLDGTFEAQMNGGVPVRGVMVPQRGRTAIRMQADDAGAVFRDAGVFKSLAGGSFDVILTPRADGPGFDGRLELRTTRLRDQPVLADLLDAVSIVGIIDQLQGPGILFDTVEARFRLLPDQLLLDQGSAVGASLGISLDGIYDLEGKQVDMQGVISPIYLFNAIGQIFTRRGEGLFGFTFTMTGGSDAPRVQVNPLSILTPGMFREIFRRAPPGSERPPQRVRRPERVEQP